MKSEHAVIIISGIAIVSFLIGFTLNALMTRPQEFGSTPAYDSGWFDITDKTGQYFNITHNLGSTDIIVDITGKRMANDKVHQRNLGGTDYTSEQGIPYGGVTMDIAYAIAQTADGGYVVAGYTYPSGGGDFWLVRTDAFGNVFPYRFKYGLAWTDSTADTITLSRGTTDPYWNYVRVRIWKN